MPVPIDDVVPSRPGQLRQEYFVDQVLMAAMEPAASILRRRPPAPQRMFPARQGYTREQPTIDDVLSMTRSNRTSFTSGPSIEPSPALRNTTGAEW